MSDLDDANVEWLFASGGPIIRYRVAVELWADRADLDRDLLRHDLLACPEVQRWLGNLGRGPIHHSCDTSVENALGKLLEYGLAAGLADMDEKIRPFFDRYGDFDDALVLTPFLARTGYGRHPVVAEWFGKRLEALHRTARRGEFDFYLPEAEMAAIPKAWRGKRIYRAEFNPVGVDFPLPTCFDFYALAHWPAGDSATRTMIEEVVRFISAPAFQSTAGAYIWNPDRRQCYAAGRTFLACVAPERLVMFMELGARFVSARAAPWFQDGLARLESYRTPQGRYRFPVDLLKETADSYYLYAGAHMGLGEPRRRPQALEIESTFRLLRIKRLMQSEAD